MKLNHVDLQVTDLPGTRAFFETFFGLQCVYARTELALLQDEAGFELVLSNLSKATAVQYPPDFHIGFVLDDVEQVKEIYARVKAAGYAIKFELQQAGPSLAFQCWGPDALPVEVRAPLAR